MIERLLNSWRGRVETAEKSGVSDKTSDGLHPLQIVMSVPPEHRESLSARLPHIGMTYEVFHQLVLSAKREIRIFSPFIDATFTSLSMQTRVPIRVITTVRDKKQKAVGVVERCASARDVSVRYIHQMKEGSHLYQLHAKMVIADESAAYVGSANLTDAGVHYNFELGFQVADPRSVKRLAALFDYLYDCVGFPAKLA